ncbi:MAG: SH3 domain-containing protein, partial [Planctomycetota bacterium]
MEFHINSAKDTGQPTFGKNTVVILTLIILVVLASVSSGREAAGARERATAAGDVKKSVLSFPYIAEIMGDNVNIRSGRGTNYYSCGKVNKGDRVKVVNQQFGWSCIVPPAGSFSWISMQYIGIDTDNPTVGIVTGDGVRVYAGSDLIKPIHSTTLQRKLNWGDKVKLLGEVKDKYHKIAPPEGAYLWVSTQYTKVLGPAGKVRPTDVVPTRTEVKPTPKVVRTDLSADAALKKYYALEKLIEAERAKPIAKQNYEQIKNELTEIAGSKKAGKAVRYSESALKLVER